MSNDARRYLSQVRYIDQNISSRQHELDNLRTNIPSGSDWKQDVVSQTRSQKSFVDRLVQLDEEISQKVDDLVNVKEAITKQIDALELNEHIVILRERYLNQKTFDYIARALHTSERHAKRLHGDALTAFGTQFEKEINEFSKTCP